MILLTLLLASSARGAGAEVLGRSTEQDLRLDWTAAEDRRGRPVVTGYIYNRRAGSYATAVRLLVEALDASGRVAGSTSGLVIGDVPPSDRSYFEIKAPPKAASYRVTIQTLSWRTYGAGGGG
ncbi:MAG TPA: hypothetical protein VMC04_13725 [Verrucomicrobiae bacterium]|nr:hypothetical protein [Verrucomicrobiae bacterium]